MFSTTPSPAHYLRPFLPGNKPLFALCAIIALAMFLGGQHADFLVYHTAVEQYLGGGWQAVYDPKAMTPFKYHPFTVWLFLPFGVLPAGLAAAMWAIANGWFSYAAARRFQVYVGTPDWVPALALVCVGHAWSWQIKFGNVTALMLWLFALFAMSQHAKFRTISAALLILLKPFWVLLLPVFVLQKQWRSFLATIGLVLAGSMLVWLLHPESGAQAYELWQKTLADPTNAHNYPKNDNQCLYAGLFGLEVLSAADKFWFWAAISGAVYMLALLPLRKKGHVALAVSVLPPMLFAGPLTWIHHQILLIPVFILLLAEKRYWVAGLAALLLTGTGEAFTGRSLFVELHQQRVPVLGYLVLMLGVWQYGRQKAN